MTNFALSMTKKKKKKKIKMLNIFFSLKVNPGHIFFLQWEHPHC